MATTMRGHKIDIASMAARNPTVRAVGNARMNARGDRVGPGNSIVKSREQIDKEVLAYHRENPNAVRSTSISALESEVYTPAEATASLKIEQKAETETAKPTKAKKVVSDD